MHAWLRRWCGARRRVGRRPPGGRQRKRDKPPEADTRLSLHYRDKCPVSTVTVTYTVYAFFKIKVASLI